MMNQATMIWTGRVLSTLYVLFTLVASAAPKLIGADVARNAMGQLGWDVRYTLAIGIIELVCVALYVIPTTSLLGAILSTALLGGAIASQLRAGAPMFSHVLFGIYLALFMWGGLWLRQPTLRAMFPVRVS
jgi:hypothetical protein